METDVLKQEITALCRHAVFLDIAAYCISIPFLGLTLSFALGLLLGTAVLWISLLLLRRNVKYMTEQTVQNMQQNQKRHLANYLMRMLIFSAAFAAAWSLALAAALGVAIPMLYPRLIYTADAIVCKS